MNRLIGLFGVLLCLGCTPINVKEGFRRWNETGKLYIVVDGSIRSLIREEAEDAIGRWIECGTEYEKRMPKVIIIGDSEMKPPKPGYVTCGVGEVKGTTLILNSNFSLFIWNKVCVNYQHTIGHELAHLMGYLHETDEEYQLYNARMAICGFPMPKTVLRPNLPANEM